VLRGQHQRRGESGRLRIQCAQLQRHAFGNRARGDAHRTVCLIPSSAHGTTRMVIPTTSCPASFISAAATEESTPPDRPSILLIPKASEEIFGERLARLPEEERIQSIRHRILRGDTLSMIAQHYRTTVDRLLKVNHLDNTEIIAGEFIVVPGS